MKNLHTLLLEDQLTDSQLIAIEAEMRKKDESFSSHIIKSIIWVVGFSSVLSMLIIEFAKFMSI